MFCFVAGVLLMMHEDAFLINRTCPVSECIAVQVDLKSVSIVLNSMAMAPIMKAWEKAAGGFNL